MSTRLDFKTRFWAKVNKSDEGCWEWKACRDLRGYGKVGIGGSGRTGKAHRISFEMAYGPIPGGLYVLHTCDNPSCVRNDEEGFYELNGILHPRRGHLWIGTSADNIADMDNKLRRVSLTGELHPHAILTKDAVELIRARYDPRVVTQRQLAEEFGCSEGAIWGVLHGRRYGSVAIAE